MTGPSLPANIEQLLAQYEKALEEHADLLANHAVLWARYAHGGTAEKFRDSAYQQLKAQLRKRYATSTTKVTEARLDEEATASSAWQKVLQDLNEGREAYLKSKARVDQLNNRIRLFATRLRLLGDALSGTGAQLDGEEAEGGLNAV